MRGGGGAWWVRRLHYVTSAQVCGRIGDARAVPAPISCLDEALGTTTIPVIALRANCSSPSDNSLDLTMWLVLSGGYDQVNGVDWEELSCFCVQTVDLQSMGMHTLLLIILLFSYSSSVAKATGINHEAHI